MADDAVDDAPKKGEAKLSKDEKDALNAHTFGQVAIARGSKWAEASMAALHKKERAQAVQILQLRQDLERAKSTAEQATRALAELKQQMREQVAEPPPQLHSCVARQCAPGASSLPMRTPRCPAQLHARARALMALQTVCPAQAQGPERDD